MNLLNALRWLALHTRMHRFYRGPPLRWEPSVGMVGGRLHCRRTGREARDDKGDQ